MEGTPWEGPFFVGGVEGNGVMFRVLREFYSFCPSWIVGDCHCLYPSEIPPAGAPFGGSTARRFWACTVRPFALPRRSAQDDTEGYSGRVLYNSHPS